MTKIWRRKKACLDENFNTSLFTPAINLFLCFSGRLRIENIRQKYDG